MKQHLNQLTSALVEIAEAYPQHSKKIGTLLGIVNQIPAEIDRLTRAVDGQRQAAQGLKSQLEQANILAQNWQATAELRDKKVAELQGVVGDRERAIAALRQNRLAEHQDEVSDLTAEIERLKTALAAEVRRTADLNLLVQNMKLEIQTRDKEIAPLQEAFGHQGEVNEELRQLLLRNAEQQRLQALQVQQLLGANGG